MTTQPYNFLEERSEWTAQWFQRGMICLMMPGEKKPFSYELKKLNNAPSNPLAIGCGGWDGNGRLHWVGIDLDVKHGAARTSYEITDQAIDAARRIRDFVGGAAEIRLSKSGIGVHVRVRISGIAANGREYARTIAWWLAEKTGIKADRAVLGRQNLWLWAAEPGPDGFKLIEDAAGEFYAWANNDWSGVEGEIMKQRILPWLHGALRYAVAKGGGMELVPFESNPQTVNNVVDSIRALVCLSSSITPPCWLSDGEGLPDPKNIIVFPHGILDLETGKIMDPTPDLFHFNCIDFDYVPDAPEPKLWLEFLGQLWDDDSESIELLQEWAGYCLTGSVAQQKILYVLGPPRSGKGTIARVLRRLVGERNVCHPTTDNLAAAFGIQSLFGKSLAIISDARLEGRMVGTVVERLLTISGEDSLTIERKYLDAITLKLPVRFMFLANKLPRMNDAGGALARRFLVLSLTESFLDREDNQLTEKLCRELPGILLWAIAGLKRLRERGHFVQPQASLESLLEIEDLSAPVKIFVRDCCEMSPDFKVGKKSLWDIYKIWCEREGRKYSTREVLGINLKAAFPKITVHQKHDGTRYYHGIKPLESLISLHDALEDYAQ